MSRRSERKAAHKAAKNAQKQAEKDLRTARDSARKAFDLKDPRFLGEAAVAATRGPAGLALFGASRGLQVARDKRAERAELLDSLTTDAKQHAATVREHASELVEPSAPPAKRRGVLRRFAPLWIIGLTGGAALAGATAYFLRAFFEMSGKIRTGDDADPPVKPVLTLLVGVVGGLMVGITSVGSGTVIMMCIMLLYPTLSALRLVGTDLVQAVPLVIAAAIGHVMVTGVDWSLLLPLLIGGAVGTYLGSRVAGRVPSGLIRRGITIVLAVTAAAMLGAPPALVGALALVLVALGPLVWRGLVGRYSAHLSRPRPDAHAH